MDSQMKALDLFCGGGGACKGLQRAGFHVTGIDASQQPHYPGTSIQGDALAPPVQLEAFDLIWASPPCQRYSAATRQSGDPSHHPDLVAPVRAMLKASGVPWVLENVLGSPLRDPVTLCGSMFGLGVIRHRLFETSWVLPATPEHVHRGSIVTGEYVTVAGNGGVPGWTLKTREARGLERHIPGEMSLARWQQAMGIDWLPRKQLVQAIPPAYAEWIARTLGQT